MAIHSSVSTLQEITGVNTESDTLLGCSSLLTEVLDVCADIPELLFGVQVGVEEKVNSQLKTLFGHGLVVWMLQLCL